MENARHVLLMPLGPAPEAGAEHGLALVLPYCGAVPQPQTLERIVVPDAAGRPAAFALAAINDLLGRTPPDAETVFYLPDPAMAADLRGDPGRSPADGVPAGMLSEMRRALGVRGARVEGAPPHRAARMRWLRERARRRDENGGVVDAQARKAWLA